MSEGGGEDGGAELTVYDSSFNPSSPHVDVVFKGSLNEAGMLCNREKEGIGKVSGGGTTVRATSRIMRGVRGCFPERRQASLERGKPTKNVFLWDGQKKIALGTGSGGDEVPRRREEDVEAVLRDAKAMKRRI